MDKRNAKALSVVMALLMLPDASLAARRPLRPSNYPAARSLAVDAASPVRKARRGGVFKLFSGKKSTSAKSKASHKKKPAPVRKDDVAAGAADAIALEPIAAAHAARASEEHIATIDLDRHTGKVSRLSAAKEPTRSQPPRLEILEDEAAGAPAFAEASGPEAVSVNASSGSVEPAPIAAAAKQAQPAGSGWKGGYHDSKGREDVDQLAGRYGVSRESILRYNRVPQSGPIPEGRKLFIPPASFQPVQSAGMAAPKTIAARVAPLAVPAAPKAPVARPEPQTKAPVAVASKADAGDDDAGPLDKIKDTIGGVFDGFKRLWSRARGRDKKQPPPAPAAVPQIATVPQAPPRERSSEEIAAPRFEWPISGQVISPFGPRHGVPHNGLDISARRGTPIQAAAGGRVIFASVMRGYGNVIILDHGDKYFTVYAHNQKNLVGKADATHPIDVKAGQTIALVGDSGNAQSPHLHFEVRFENKAVDPTPLLPAAGSMPHASRTPPANADSRV